jgi:S1-C subfamily serine protease
MSTTLPAPPRGWAGRRSLAVLMTITALLGGAASTRRARAGRRIRQRRAADDHDHRDGLDEHRVRHVVDERGREGDLRERFRVSMTESTGTTGARVASVTAGSPAASAGLKAGDVVTAINGKQITGSSDLVAAIAGRHPGDRIQLTVRRGSDTLTVTGTLGTQPATQRSAPQG